MESLRPNIIVATVSEAAALRQTSAADLPVVILNDVMDPETLVEEIRRELRAHLKGE
jgi:alanine racemase